ncbi:MAG TPA: hypothetical protein VGV14_09920 [Rhodanobacter sp.]|nr:hypothetical protein [Rhodanobacter sp.]
MSSRSFDQLCVMLTCTFSADEAAPLMPVILEWFSGAHSIYRTHSASIRAARERFRVVGIGHAGQVDAMGKSVFDEYLEVSGETVPFVRMKAEELRPDIV